jgi:hypothetical protein
MNSFVKIIRKDMNATELESKIVMDRVYFLNEIFDSFADRSRGLK